MCPLHGDRGGVVWSGGWTSEVVMAVTNHGQVSSTACRMMNEDRGKNSKPEGSLSLRSTTRQRGGHLGLHFLPTDAMTAMMYPIDCLCLNTEKGKKNGGGGGGGEGGTNWYDDSGLPYELLEVYF